MVSTITKELTTELASLPGWTIAERFNCGYSGDSSPTIHGGFFYDFRTWETEGYARCVEFWHDPESPKLGTNLQRLVVQQGTIHRPKTEDQWESCWSCLGIAKDDPNRQNVHAQVEAVRGGCGIEPAGTSYPYLMDFNLTTWHEAKIWHRVIPWLQELGW